MKSLMKRIGTIAVLMCLSASAHAWWNPDWSYRMRINLDTGANGATITEPLARTPVLVRLHSGNLNFADAKPDGSDLRFVAGDDKTVLPFHLETFDPRGEVALAWVDVSNLQPGATTAIYAYYGNSKAAPASSPASTYGPDEVLVWHFEGSGLPTDATSNANTAPSGPTTRDPNGLIGPAIRLDGKEPLALPGSDSLHLAAGQPLTVSVWVRADEAGRDGILFAVPGAIQVGLKAGVPFLTVGSSTATSTAAIAAATWTHLALRAETSSTSLLVDGAVVATLANGLPASDTPGYLGGAPGATGFVGEMDELEISKSALPVSALLLAARSQGLNARLLTFDTAEQRADASHSYLGVLIKALTPDAWVVIILLAIMSAISWFVMISKGMALNGIISANDAFLEEYRRSISRRPSHSGLAGPDVDGRLQASSLARLFDLGRRELIERLNEAGPATPGDRYAISPQSVAAIRSALDAGHAREGQRLNRGMVLLTIAISGGPFLGLLGTVVGVMITFAAVAAAGDVNINAIAPGIAAALLATVAGLAVAIPALFGYNYLLSRVEDISTDHQLFVDELEKRIAETYRAAVGG
jgi:biopolymer transport protein ExbB